MKPKVSKPVKRRIYWKGFPKIPGILVWSFLHGLFLLTMGYVWLGMNYTFGDEAFLIKWTTLVKKELLSIDSKPSPQDVLFINTSLSKVPVNTNADPLSLKPAVELITNREKLAGLLELMTPYKDRIDLVVVDILFDIPAEGDSYLETQFGAFGDKILAVSTISEADTIVTPRFDVPYALSTYRSAAGMYFKYPVAYKGMKTLPTAMYEITTGSTLEKRGLFFRDKQHYSFKSPVTDFKVTMKDFQLGDNLNETHFAVHHLETVNLLGQFMDESDREAFFSGKVVMIGDFSTDIHKTVVGFMPGVLVLYNAYLTLLNGENRMSIGWLLLMLAGFIWISYRIWAGNEIALFMRMKQKHKARWFHFIIDSVDELFYLSLLTLVSYFFFNIHINILVLFIYLKLVEFVLDLYRNKQKIKR